MVVAGVVFYSAKGQKGDSRELQKEEVKFMPNAEKVKLVAQIKDEISATDALWVVDYRGLSVKQSESLRQVIRQSGAAIKIYKNTLTQRAVAELELPDLGEILEGPSAFVFVEGDPVASAKALKVFAKENEALEIKGGLLDGSVVTQAQIKTLADMPSREDLLAQVLGLLTSPLQSVVSAIDVPTTLVRSLDAVAEKAA
jgi:large subunit ribosomal protein L10